MGLSCILFIHPCPSWPPWQCSSEDTWMKTASTCSGGFQRHHSGFPKDLVHCVLTPQKNTENEPLELQKSTKNWKKTKTSSSEGLALTFHFLVSSTCRVNFLQAHCEMQPFCWADDLNSASCWDNRRWLANSTGVALKIFNEVRLMVQKSQTTTVWMYKTHLNNGISYQPQLVSRISSINTSKTWDILFEEFLFPNDKWSVHPGCMFYKGDEILATYTYGGF